MVDDKASQLRKKRIDVSFEEFFKNTHRARKQASKKASKHPKGLKSKNGVTGKNVMNALSNPTTFHEAIQCKAKNTQKSKQIQSIAQKGVSGQSTSLPHLETIQEAFGKHSLQDVQAHISTQSAQANKEMGSRAYASGNQIAFTSQPDLHLAAHEAAHVIQQRAGVHLSGGVGQEGDVYERHADAVADAVVQGKSVEGLLDGCTGGQHEGVQFSAQGGGQLETGHANQSGMGQGQSQGGMNQNASPQQRTQPSNTNHENNEAQTDAQSAAESMNSQANESTAQDQTTPHHQTTPQNSPQEQHPSQIPIQSPSNTNEHNPKEHQRPLQDKRRKKKPKGKGGYWISPDNSKIRLYGFDCDKDVIKSEHTEGLHKFLKQVYPMSDTWWKCILTTRGHASPEGEEDYNERLAEKRADKIISTLFSLGHLEDGWNAKTTLTGEAKRYLRSTVAPFGEYTSRKPGSRKDPNWWRGVEILYKVQSIEFEDDIIESSSTAIAKDIYKHIDHFKGEFPDYYLEDAKNRLKVVMNSGDTLYLSSRDVRIYCNNAMYQYRPEVVASDLKDELHRISLSEKRGSKHMTKMFLIGPERSIRGGLQEMYRRSKTSLQKDRNIIRLVEWTRKKQKDPNSVLYNKKSEDESFGDSFKWWVDPPKENE